MAAIVVCVFGNFNAYKGRKKHIICNAELMLMIIYSIVNYDGERIRLADHIKMRIASGCILVISKISYTERML